MFYKIITKLFFSPFFYVTKLYYQKQQIVDYLVPEVFLIYMINITVIFVSILTCHLL